MNAQGSIYETKQEVMTKKENKLVFKNPQQFNGQSGVKITTTLSLCRLVNDLFKTLSDYEGCIIDVNRQTGMLQCSLFFHLSQPGQYNMVQSADQMNTSAGVMEKYNRISARSQNRKLFLTDLAKEILFDFVYKQPNQKEPNKYNWNAITYEKYDQQQYGQGVALLEVEGIDLNKLVSKFYANPDRRHYQWNIGLLKPVGMINNMGTMNHLVQITRLDCNEVEALGKELGFFTPSGSIPIVR